MGFTRPDADLFKAWARYRQARDHMMDFVDTLRRPLLEVLCDALAVTHPDVDRGELADFASRGSKTPRVVFPRLGTVTVGFRIPATGPERLQAGVHDAEGEPYFVVEVPAPDTPARTAALDTLSPNGFWTWRNGVGTDIALTDEVLLSPDLQEIVIEFSRTSFQMIAESGILALRPVVTSPEEDDEYGI